MMNSLQIKIEFEKPVGRLSSLSCMALVNHAILQMYGVTGQGLHKFDLLKMNADNVCTIAVDPGSVSLVRAALTLLGEYDGQACRCLVLDLC